jgi:tetratricopeptide (TPR) repeat protein
VTRKRSDRTPRSPGCTRAAGAARALVIALAAALLLAGPVAQAPASPANCSAEQGQAFIDAGRYEQAIREFTCLIDAEPTEVEGYRGRGEAELLLGRYSDALAEYAQITALVMPVQPDAVDTILAGYDDRLATAPNDIAALTGASFARWASFQYAQAIHLLNQLLEVSPDDDYATLFRGSSRLLRGATRERGIADLERAIALAPQSPDVRFVVADAYTYGLPDPERAFAEASLALDWGLDTPRVHAILASAYDAFGDRSAAASHIQRSIELVTTELVTASPIASGASLTVDLVPGRTYEIPVAAIAGETISVATSSKDFYDSIAVLLAPDGTPVVGSDDENAYFAAFEYTAEETGTYLLQVTSFEGVNTGELVVTRD